MKPLNNLKIHLRACEKHYDRQQLAEQVENLQVESNNTHEGENSASSLWEDVEKIGLAAESIYEEIVFWKKNLFKLPSGLAGKRYIKELTRLINIWNEDAPPLSKFALKLSMIMPALLLQKPCRKSTAKQHGQYLRRRMDLWEEGKFDEIMREVRFIQEKIKPSLTNTERSLDHLAKVFAKLVLKGKIHAALRLLDKNEAAGIINMSDEVLKELQKLHPDGERAKEYTLKTGDIPYFDPVVFSNIDESSIAKAATKTKGAAGPSGMDADQWRRILINKNFGLTGKDLREAIAKMTQKLCTQEIEIPEEGRSSIEAYTSCR